MNLPLVYMCSPSWTLLLPPSPYHPSGSSQCTSHKHPVSGIEPGLASRFIHDILHVSMPFSQIFPPSPSVLFFWGATVTESEVLLLASQNPIKRPNWWKGKFALFRMLSWGGQRLSKGRLSLPRKSGDNSFYRQREGATGRKSTISSDSHLEIGYQWSDHQCHLDCFSCSWSSVPGSIYFHFVEATYWNCGSLCHGYNLVVM